VAALQKRRRNPNSFALADSAILLRRFGGSFLFADYAEWRTLFAARGWFFGQAFLQGFHQVDHRGSCYVRDSGDLAAGGFGVD
jgi:hypothetical protein